MQGMRIMSKNSPFGIQVKFNVLHATGKGINVKIMRESAHYLYKCAEIILNDPENKFNHEALKCYSKLCRQSEKIMAKADELEKEDF